MDIMIYMNVIDKRLMPWYFMIDGITDIRWFHDLFEIDIMIYSHILLIDGWCYDWFKMYICHDWCKIDAVFDMILMLCLIWYWCYVWCNYDAMIEI